MWAKVQDLVGRTHIKLLIVVELGAREGRVAQRSTERVAVGQGRWALWGLQGTVVRALWRLFQASVQSWAPGCWSALNQGQRVT